MDIVAKILELFNLKKIKYDMYQIKNSSKAILIGVPILELIGGTVALYFLNSLTIYSFIYVLIISIINYKVIFKYTPREIVTASTVVVELLVNVLDETRKITSVPLNKPIEFLPNSSNIELEITIYLTLAGTCTWHPCSNWNISYNVEIEDTKGRNITIIKERQWIDFNRWDSEHMHLWMTPINESLK